MDPCFSLKNFMGLKPGDSRTLKQKPVVCCSWSQPKRDHRIFYLATGLVCPHQVETQSVLKISKTWRHLQPQRLADERP